MEIINSILKEKLSENKCYKIRYAKIRVLYFDEIIAEYNYIKEYHFYFVIGFKSYYFLDIKINPYFKFKPNYNYIFKSTY